MLQQNKKPYICVFWAFLFVCSCQNSPEIITIPNKISTLPISGFVTTQEGSFFKKDSDTILFLAEDCVLEVADGSYNLKKGTVMEIESPEKKRLKNIKLQTLFFAETGSFSFFRMLIPKKFVVEEIDFEIKYLIGEKVQDSKKGGVYSYYEDSLFNFYGVFLPFSPLYEQDNYSLSIRMSFRDGDKAVIYSVGEIKKKTFKEQQLNFSKGKSKDLESASRKKYNVQQAARHELWRTVTQPLPEDVWQITKPLDNISRLTSDFGFTRRWILDSGKQYSRDVHLGVDYGVPTGTSIYSLLDGVVVLSGMQELYGNMVIVNHGLGLYTNYCHMNKCLVNADSVIKKGGILGEVGMTGASTGPHLHIETRIYGIPIDYRKLESLPELFVIDVDKTKWIDK